MYTTQVQDGQGWEEITPSYNLSNYGSDNGGGGVDAIKEWNNIING